MLELTNTSSLVLKRSLSQYNMQIFDYLFCFVNVD